MYHSIECLYCFEVPCLGKVLNKVVAVVVVVVVIVVIVVAAAAVSC